MSLRRSAKPCRRVCGVHSVVSFPGVHVLCKTQLYVALF